MNKHHELFSFGSRQYASMAGKTKIKLEAYVLLISCDKAF